MHCNTKRIDLWLYFWYNKKDERIVQNRKFRALYPKGERRAVHIADKTSDFALKLKRALEKTLNDKKAADVVSLDLTGKSDIADFIIIASGTSNTHVDALAGYITRTMRENGVDILSVEGAGKCDWVLIDSAYIVVHVFTPETRKNYNLEKMWQADFSSMPVHQIETVL